MGKQRTEGLPTPTPPPQGRRAVGTLTSEHPSGQVELQETGGEGCEDHARRRQQSAHQHDRATAKASHEDAGHRACGQGRVTTRPGPVISPVDTPGFAPSSPGRRIRGQRSRWLKDGSVWPRSQSLAETDQGDSTLRGTPGRDPSWARAPTPRPKPKGETPLLFDLHCGNHRLTCFPHPGPQPRILLGRRNSSSSAPLTGGGGFRER